MDKFKKNLINNIVFVYYLIKSQNCFLGLVSSSNAYPNTDMG